LLFQVGDRVGSTSGVAGFFNGASARPACAAAPSAASGSMPYASSSSAPWVRDLRQCGSSVAHRGCLRLCGGRGAVKGEAGGRLASDRSFVACTHKLASSVAPQERTFADAAVNIRFVPRRTDAVQTDGYLDQLVGSNHDGLWDQLTPL